MKTLPAKAEIVALSFVDSKPVRADIFVETGQSKWIKLR
jgi:hypothetical protein